MRFYDRLAIRIPDNRWQAPLIDSDLYQLLNIDFLRSRIVNLTFTYMSSRVSRTETYAVSVVIRCNRMDTESALVIDRNDTPRTRTARLYGCGPGLGGRM
jgi:hypothetical protein